MALLKRAVEPMSSKVSPSQTEILKMKRGLGSIMITFSFIVILLGCTQKAAFGPQEPTSKEKGGPFIDVHNHFAGHYGSRSGGRGTDFEGAGRVAYTTPGTSTQIGSKVGEETKYLSAILPAELARKVGSENAYRIFNLAR